MDSSGSVANAPMSEGLAAQVVPAQMLDLSGYGLFVLEWNRKSTAGSPVTVFAVYLDNDTSIAVIHFKEDSKTVLAIPEGRHKLSIRIPALDVEFEVKSGQSCTIRINYSVAYGRLSFENANTYSPASTGEIRTAFDSASSRRRLLDAGAGYLAQGYGFVKITDSSLLLGVPIKDSSVAATFVLFLLGIIPGLIYMIMTIVRESTTNMVLLETNPDGSIASKVIRQKEARRMIREHYI